MSRSPAPNCKAAPSVLIVYENDLSRSRSRKDEQLAAARRNIYVNSMNLIGTMKELSPRQLGQSRIIAMPCL